MAVARHVAWRRGRRGGTHGGRRHGAPRGVPGAAVPPRLLRQRDAQLCRVRRVRQGRAAAGLHLRDARPGGPRPAHRLVDGRPRGVHERRRAARRRRPCATGRCGRARRGASRGRPRGGPVRDDGCPARRRARGAAHGGFVRPTWHVDLDWVDAALDRDAEGLVVVDRAGRTSVPGLYAVGDVTPPGPEQLIVAAGHGATTAAAVHRDLVGGLTDLRDHVQ
ncbi:FAD-dependent oxidoreductase [Curtobacterium sp. SL109]|uniref:FAD-dependent oxidoreductase n=1 Tax=Curtobacterium sp. SL109 TaxID=2994662 RepID=UPI002DD43715|nr:FAD-dependent oxidoreductase [Curtobacterium sp. SL109]